MKCACCSSQKEQNCDKINFKTNAYEEINPVGEFEFIEKSQLYQNKFAHNLENANISSEDLSDIQPTSKHI